MEKDSKPTKRKKNTTKAKSAAPKKAVEIVTKKEALPHHVLTLERYKENRDSTLGQLSLNGVFQCFTLEDERREVKVKHETRIDAGTYPVVLREILTGLTKKYRKRFEWFKWHIEIKDLPRHEDVYIHIGNTAEDSSGCVLVGARTYTNALGHSVRAYKELYKKVVDLLDAGHTMEIQIINKD